MDITFITIAAVAGLIVGGLIIYLLTRKNNQTLTAAAQEKAEEYESGYHKAIEDFTCPYTGNINMPEKKIEVPSKKPDR